MSRTPTKAKPDIWSHPYGLAVAGGFVHMLVKQDGDFLIGKLMESHLHGVMTQGKTFQEVAENLREAYRLMLDADEASSITICDGQGRVLRVLDARTRQPVRS